MNIIVGMVQEFRNGLNKQIKKKGIIMNDLKDLTEKELNKALWDAIEMQYGGLIRLIREEMNRQVREA